MGESLLASWQDEVLTLSLNRPDRRNAIDLAMVAEFRSILRKIKKNNPPRVLLLRAEPNSADAPKNVWTSGGDQLEFQSFSKADFTRYARWMTEVCQTIADLPLPVVAAISGKVLGGGMELALSADIRMATVSSTFAFRQLDVGLSTGFGGGARLTSLVGLGVAQRLQLLSAEIGAEEALRLGILTQVAATDDGLEKEIRQVIDKLLSYDSRSFASQKMLLTETSAKRSVQAFVSLWKNPKHRQHLRAFKKGRQLGGK